MIDKLLERTGLKYNDLRPDERETINTMVAALEKSAMTPEKLRDYIASMKRSVEEGLTKTDHNTKEDIFLKSSLRNYLLLEALLLTPEKVKEQLDQMMAGLVSAKVDNK